MPITGRSFPTHPIADSAGVSNAIQVLNVVCPTSLRLMKQKSFKMTVTSATVSTIRPLKLAGFKTIKATSAVTAIVTKATGKGRILKVTSATTNTIKKSTSKTLRVTSATNIRFVRSIVKILKKVQASIPNIFPGIFRAGATNGTLVVQSRPFNLIMQNWRAIFDN